MNHAIEQHRELMQPNWNSTYMSVIAGAAAYYGLQYSAPEFFVESGYFAAINIQRDIKPCGPYCWDHSPVAKNLKSMGLCLTWLHSPYDYQSFEFREHILKEILAMGTDTIVCMAGLEFQLLIHRDDQKFTFALPWGPNVPTCVHELPFEDWLEVKYFPGTSWFSLKSIAVAPRAKRLRDSLTGALSFYEQNERFEQPDYFFGPNAWEQWANQLESGSYDKHGHWWNSMVWSEARQQAATYFDKDWPGPVNLGKELRTQYAEISSLIAKSATQETSNLDRAELIRQAQDIDAQTLQNLVSCREFLLSDS